VSRAAARRAIEVRDRAVDIVIARVRAPLRLACDALVETPLPIESPTVRADHRLGGKTVAEAEGSRLGKGSAADLLSNWRAAERDRVAAEESASVAALAAAAAKEAGMAAEETAAAARLSLEAAQSAERAARRTSEAAELAARTASREATTADAALEASRAAEDEAKALFQSGQARGFEKDEA
jgi:hypothetical protein